MSIRSIADILDSARHDAGLTSQDLWIGYYGLGGHDSPRDIDGYLAGLVLPARAEYDLLAQTLNDRFIEARMDPLVPYADDLDLFQPGALG